MQAVLEVAVAFSPDSDQAVISNTSGNSPKQNQLAEVCQQSDLKPDIASGNNIVTLEKKPVKRDFSAFCDCV